MEACQQGLNDRTSETQISVPKRSCLSVCLRFGLFVLFLLKLVVNYWLTELLYKGLINCLYSSTLEYSTLYISLINVAMFIDALDIVMGLTLIISYYVKYVKLLKLFHKSSIYIFILLSVLCCLLMYMILHNMWSVIQLLFLLTPCLLIQLCVNYVVKNDIPAMESDVDCRV